MRGMCGSAGKVPPVPVRPGRQRRSVGIHWSACMTSDRYYWKSEANHVPSHPVPPGRTLRRPVEEPVFLLLGVGADQVPNPRGDRMVDHHGGAARDRARCVRSPKKRPISSGRWSSSSTTRRPSGSRRSRQETRHDVKAVEVLRAGGPGRNLPAGRHRVGPFLLYLRGHQQPRLRPHAQGRDPGGMAAERPGN